MWILSGGVRAAQAAFVLALVATSVSAKEARFVLRPAGEGFIRLDTQTGRLTHCRPKNAEWICVGLEGGGAPVAEQTIENLRLGNEALAKRLEELERTVDHLSLEQKSSDPELRLPSDDEMDQVFGFMEKFMRRFMDLGRTLSGRQSKDI